LAAGLRVRTSWIFDSPLATEESLDRTIDMILELRPHEVRAHYLSLRACAPFADEAAARSNPLTAQQYIHADEPHSSFDSLAPELIMERVRYLSDELKSSGYLVVRNPADWEAFDNGMVGHRDLRFISFCPGRYGIGWER
jgi:hypothetical protein